MKRFIKYFSFAIVLVMLLYVLSVALQLYLNYQQWQIAGADFGVSPELPDLHINTCVDVLLHTKAGWICTAIAFAATIGLAIYTGVTDDSTAGVGDDRKGLLISNAGSFGTASFMSKRDAAKCFDITTCARTKGDILGMMKDGRVFTLPKNTRLNQNLAICGASGTGKSRSVSRNLILQAARRDESIIVTDTKSELYESMSEYLRNQGYVVKVLNLVNMDHSDAWNCLAEVGDSELMATTFADIVLRTSGNDHDAFWYNAELNLLKALVLYVSLELPPEKRNFASVYDMLVTQNERSLRSIMQSISREHINAYTGEVLPPSPAFAPFSIFMQASETVRTSVIVGLGSKLQVMQAQQVKNITSHNEIDLELPGKRKCAYFCIVSDQDSTFEFLSTLFFSFLFIRLIRYADNFCEGNTLPTKVKFILDEFPNCSGSIPDFEKKCSTIRSRGCSVAVFFQNIGQMKNRYPDDRWQEILGSCDTTIFLGCTDMLTAQYISDRVGTASVELESQMRERNTFRFTNYTPTYRETNSLGRRQLMTPDEVLRLPPDEELVFVRGQRVLRANRFDYSKHSHYHLLHPCKAIHHEPDWKRTGQALPVSQDTTQIERGIPTDRSNDLELVSVDLDEIM